MEFQHKTQNGKLQQTLTQDGNSSSQQKQTKKPFPISTQPKPIHQQKQQQKKKHSPLIPFTQKLQLEKQKEKYHTKQRPYYPKQKQNLSKWTNAHKPSAVKDRIQHKGQAWPHETVSKHKADSPKETLYRKKQNQNQNKNSLGSSVTHKKQYDVMAYQQKTQSHKKPHHQTISSHQSVENRENTSTKTTESGDKPVTAVSSATGSHYLISPTVSDPFSGSVISGSQHKDSDSHADILQYIRDLLRETRQVSERKLLLSL